MRATLFSDSVIDQAYQWLCKQRRHWPANADVWALCSHWQSEKTNIRQALKQGNYRFEPMQRITKSNGEVIHLWAARDALVLKALTLVLLPYLPVAKSCTHVKGHGGAKAAVRAVRDQLPHFAFVMRTDVKGYYEHINHHRMLELLADYIKDKSVLNLLCQAMRRCVTWGGLYKDINKGISRGCPLSPLLGAFYLHTLDCAMNKAGLFYVRFMDDLLILAPTRWKLKHAVKCVNQHLSKLEMEQHPDKTFIGRIEKGFDFLGYHFSSDGLTVSNATTQRFIARATRLYEQEQSDPNWPPVLGEYVRRWVGWAIGGLEDDQRRRQNVGFYEVQ